MSEENVERVRKGFEAHNGGDLDALVEFYDPDVVFETLLLGTHHGNQAIRLIYEENQKTLSGYDVVPVELIDAGDKVVAVAQTVGSGPISQIAVEDQFAFVFTFAEERCVREQAFRNKEEALEAAGLRSRRCRRRTWRSPRHSSRRSRSETSRREPGFLIPRWKFVQRLSEGPRAPSIVARPG